jgi:hypothetical protein
MARPVAYYAKKYGVPIKLAEALIRQESGGNDNAVSGKNAVGRMQIHLPSHPTVTAAQARDPDFAMDYGFRLLAGHKKKHGSWRLALAAYNAGSGAVTKYGGVPPYKETQDYVRLILGAAGVLAPAPTSARTSVTPTRSSSSGGAQDALAPTPGGLDLDASMQEGLRALASGSYSPSDALATMRRTPAQQGSTPLESPPVPAGVPDTMQAGGPSAGSSDWQKWVKRPAPRQGPSQPHGDEILQFVGRIGARGKTVLEPWGNESHSITTVNGKPSAHGTGRAADIPAKGERLKRLGYLALLEAGMPKAEALKAARQGGLYNVGGYQIIFATEVGGNHHDHLHVGLRG